MKIFPLDAESGTLNAGALATDQEVHRERVAFEPGGGNGRALDDDSVNIAVGFLAGSPLGGAVVPRAPSPAFPYLSAPQPADLPALADLFGRCGQRSEQTSSPPAGGLGACCSHSRCGVALDMSEPQPGYRPWPTNR